MKCVVFDFDETLGHFTQLGEFMNTLEEWFMKKPNRKMLYKLLDIYPFMFRPKIFKILNFIKKKHQQKKIQHVVIYTNNMGERSWVLFIKKYLELKINYNLFNRVISGYPYEKKRTTHAKTYKDLLAVTGWRNGTQILFFDDQYHPIGKNSFVKYVKLTPYVYIIHIEQMVNRFLHSRLKFTIKDKINFKGFIRKRMKQYNTNTRVKYRLPNNEHILILRKIQNFIMN